MPTYTGGRNPQLATNDPTIYSVDLTAATVTTGGAVASIANPFGAACVITRAFLRVTTGSTGAATVDIGVAANGTTTSDTLIDGQSVQTAGLLSTAGTNGATPREWGASQFVTVTASATLAGLVGALYLELVRA